MRGSQQQGPRSRPLRALPLRKRPTASCRSSSFNHHLHLYLPGTAKMKTEARVDDLEDATAALAEELHGQRSLCIFLGAHLASGPSKCCLKFHIGN